jgi:hypothetical protein
MRLAAGGQPVAGVAGPYGVMLWTVSGLALYLLLGIASVFLTLTADPLLGAVGLPVEAGELGLAVRNALHPPVWGLLVAAAAIPIGRRLVPGIRFSRHSWLVLLAGLLLAAVTWLLIEEFVRARMASFDMEYVGFTILTWPALVAIALCGWAALAAPRGSNAALVVPLVLATVGLSVALLPSVAGAADGIDAQNLPLAFVFLVDVLYAMLVIVLAFRRAAPRSRG